MSGYWLYNHNNYLPSHSVPHKEKNTSILVVRLFALWWRIREKKYLLFITFTLFFNTLNAV